MPGRDPEGRITTEIRGHLFLMGIDRVEKRNGFTPKMFAELTAAYRRLEEDAELRVGILFAHGDHFTAGLDLPKFRAEMQAGKRSYETDGVDVYGLRAKLSKPLVTAIQGIAYTLGIELMLAGDIVVAASDCRFSQLEAKRGIMAAGGATIRFVQRCGWGNAMYHLLRCDVFDSAEAYRIGLVQEIVEPGRQLERALAIGEEISRMAPLAVQATKMNSATYAVDGEAAAVAQFPEIQRRLSRTEDAAEGVASFVERREPKFKGN